MLIARRKDQAKYSQLWDELRSGLYPGAGPSGARLYDLSGCDNHATLTNGPTWVDSRGRKAISFDGVNDYIDAPKAALIGNRWTLSVWATYRSVGTSQCLFSQFTSGTVGRAFLVVNYNRVTGDVAANHLSFGTTESPAVNSLGTGTAVVSVNTMFHAVVRASGDEISLWLNGTQIATQAYSVNIQNTVSTIGRLGNLSTFFLNGTVSETLAYSRPLHADEIKLLAQRPGIIFEPKRRVFYSIPTGVKAWLFRRQSQIIGGGLG